MSPENRFMMPITKRLDANLGYICNNNCLFCYFKDRKDKRCNPTTEKIKKLLKQIRNLGITTVEMTGGEVTIRDDFLELVSFAKDELGFPNISVITNGVMFSKKDFAKEAISRGVDDVIVSVHGHNQVLHDKLTGRTGSFNDALNAISNIIDYRASARTNTVVNNMNYMHVGEIAELVVDKGVKKVNYIYFSPLDDASETQKSLWVKYSDTTQHIMQMIDEYSSCLETISIKVLPFCFLPGYEEYITDLYQNTYDPYEWDYYHRVHIRRNAIISNLASIAGIILYTDKKKAFEIGLKKSLREGIMRIEAKRHCIKSKECKICKFDYICPGIWKHYAKIFGLNEIRAIKGDKIMESDKILEKRFSDYYKKNKSCCK